MLNKSIEIYNYKYKSLVLNSRFFYNLKSKNTRQPKFIKIHKVNELRILQYFDISHFNYFDNLWTKIFFFKYLNDVLLNLNKTINILNFEIFIRLILYYIKNMWTNLFSQIVWTKSVCKIFANLGDFAALTLFSYADYMLDLLASVSHEVYLHRSHVKSSAVASKLVKACSQTDRLMFWCSEMFTDSDCDFSTGKWTRDCLIQDNRLLSFVLKELTFDVVCAWVLVRRIAELQIWTYSLRKDYTKQLNYQIK